MLSMVCVFKFYLVSRRSGEFDYSLLLYVDLYDCISNEVREVTPLLLLSRESLSGKEIFLMFGCKVVLFNW